MEADAQRSMKLPTGSHMPITLNLLREVGVVSAIAFASAKSAMRLSGEDDERVAIALGLSQTALELGHLGLRLRALEHDFSHDVLYELRERSQLDQDEDQLDQFSHQMMMERISLIDWSKLPDAREWLSLLKESPAVWCTLLPWSPRPFVLEGDVLFTLKAWRGEARVARGLVALQSLQLGELPKPDLLWRRLFGEGDACWFDGPPRWDRARLALHTALTGAFTVIHGGPGTGKTTLTQRILAALIEQYDHEGQPLRIALTAPTGKAAQRLTESIRSRAPFFHLPDDVQERLSHLQGVTLHSLLGVVPGRRPHHHRAHPLPYDIIVVDECSMVDLWLLQSLVEAIELSSDGAEKRRLLLIGDPHQLPSVSAGAPFTELCGRRGAMCSLERLRMLTEFHEKDEDEHLLEHLELTTCPEDDVNSLVDGVVALNQVRRVSAESGIHAAATAIQRVDEDGIEAVLQSFSDERYLDTELIPAPPLPIHLINEILQHAERGVSLAKLDPFAALSHLKDLCLLSPHYGGPLGVNELNELVEDELRRKRIGGWGRGYVGRPVLITQNHPPTGLVNGDIGIVGQGHHVYFDNREKAVKLEHLPAHRTVFAMSIHKSQGSEFKKVVMCIPPHRSLIMTRELIYTGLTRAKQHAVIVGSAEALAQSVKAKVERGGQLAERLTQHRSTRREEN